jgi:sigma-B regulation protein RsbU (phosphoserine phosphatase)
LKADSALKAIPVIFLSALSEISDKVKGFSVGGVDYIAKPFQFEEVRARVDTHMRLRMAQAELEERVQERTEELRLAGELQKALFRLDLEHTDGVTFTVTYQPVPGLYCGGDYFDVVRLSADKYLLLVGDVAGHGVKAAFVTSILKTSIYHEYIRNRLGKQFSPGAFLSWLNDRMTLELRNTTGIIITFFAGVLDRKAMRFTYANAGQNHPYIVSGGVPRELVSSETALGFMQSTLYSEKTETLVPGDCIFIYTDGLVEVGEKNGRGKTLSVGDFLLNVPQGDDYHKRAISSALSEAGVAEFDDDLTIVTAQLT